MLKKGFTLIELLVVISIISLLSSIVMSSLNAARSGGRDANRLSTLNQIQTALELYALNNDGNYPTDNWYETNTSHVAYWGTKVQQHLVDNGYLAAVPLDPLNDTAPQPDFFYRYYGNWSAWRCSGITDTGAAGLNDQYEYVIMAGFENDQDHIPDETTRAYLGKCILGPAK